MRLDDRERPSCVKEVEVSSSSRKLKHFLLHKTFNPHLRIRILLIDLDDIICGINNKIQDKSHATEH